jgi:hypothetical protein
MVTKICVSKKIKEELAPCKTKSEVVKASPICANAHSRLMLGLTKEDILEDFNTRRLELKQSFAGLLVEMINRKDTLNKTKEELINAIDVGWLYLPLEKKEEAC